jgi:hypothetical protein
MPSNREGLSTATATGTKNPPILGGSDQYLGTMTFISAGSDYRDRMQAADLPGTNAALPLPGTGVITRNDNAANSATVLYDITAKTDSTTNFLIGASALDCILSFRQAASGAWSNARAVMTVCGPQEGSTIPTDLVIRAGTTDTGAPCTTVYSYTVGDNNPHVVTGHNSLVKRHCRWCSAPVGSTANVNELLLKEFVPPTTATRKIKGITIFASESAGGINLSIDTD